MSQGNPFSIEVTSSHAINCYCVTRSFSGHTSTAVSQMGQQSRVHWVSNQRPHLFLVAKVSFLLRHWNVIIANQNCAGNWIFLSKTFWQASTPLGKVQFSPASYAINNKNIFQSRRHSTPWRRRCNETRWNGKFGKCFTNSTLPTSNADFSLFPSSLNQTRVSDVLINCESKQAASTTNHFKRIQLVIVLQYCDDYGVRGGGEAKNQNEERKKGNLSDKASNNSFYWFSLTGREANSKWSR